MGIKTKEQEEITAHLKGTLGFPCQNQVKINTVFGIWYKILALGAAFTAVSKTCFLGAAVSLVYDTQSTNTPTLGIGSKLDGTLIWILFSMQLFYCIVLGVEPHFIFLFSFWLWSNLWCCGLSLSFVFVLFESASLCIMKFFLG